MDVNNRANETTWQSRNRAALTARLADARYQPDGTVFMESVVGDYPGDRYVVVTKTGNRMLLWLMDLSNTDTAVVQSEIDLDEPLTLVDPYTQAAMLSLLWQPRPRRVHCAGLGAGRVPLVMRHYLPETTFDCVENEPKIVEVASRFFGLATDDQLRVTVADGRDWLATQHADVRYDIMFIDVFEDDGTSPAHMTTVGYFRLCRQHLTDEGIMVVNLISEDPREDAKIKTIATAFPQVHLCPMGDDNTIVFATNGPAIRTDDLIERAVALQQEHHFSFPFVRRATAIVAREWQGDQATR